MKKKIYALKLNENSTKEKWLKIGVTGHWKGHSAGEFELDQHSYQQMIDNAKKRGLDIVTDYEHATLWSFDKAPAAGWISIDPLHLKVEDGELYAQIEWTATAAAHIEAKEYKFLSPVFVPNTLDQITGDNIGWTLHSVALTNTPFLSELGAIENKMNQQKEKNDMGIQEDLNKVKSDLDQATTAISAKDQKIADLEKQLEETNKEKTEAMVNSLIAEGKIAASQKDWAVKYALSDKEGFETYLSGVVPAMQDMEMFANSQSPGKKISAIDMSKV